MTQFLPLRRMFHVLDGHEVREEPDLMTWAAWMEGADRQVALTQLPDEVEVSTVFLGLASILSGSTPLVFETAIFTNRNTERRTVEVVERYATWAEAEVGHMETVEKLSQEQTK